MTRARGEKKPDEEGKPSRPSRRLAAAPRKASRRARAVDDKPRNNKNGEKPLVLVVDDYADAREMCCEYLQYVGYRVAEAKSGTEALEKAFELLPDCILMDLSLPGLDGSEATRRLKADPRTREIPIVALTGHTLSKQAPMARAPYDAFLTKPCMPDVMVEEVQRLLDLKADSKADRRPKTRD